MRPYIRLFILSLLHLSLRIHNIMNVINHSYDEFKRKHRFECNINNLLFISLKLVYENKHYNFSFYQNKWCLNVKLSQ